MGKEKSRETQGNLKPEVEKDDQPVKAKLCARPTQSCGDLSDSAKHGSLAQAHSYASVADGFADSLDAIVRRDIDRFVSNIECGIDFWIKAGEILVKMKKDDPDVFQVITKCHPWVTLDVLETMHSIGLKALHPRVLLLPPKIASSVAAMPYDAQKYVVESNAPVLVAREGSHSRATELKDLSRAEAGRVFRPSGVALPKDQILRKAELLGVWELSVLGTILHARRVSNGIAGRTIWLSAGTCYVRLVK